MRIQEYFLAEEAYKGGWIGEELLQLAGKGSGNQGGQEHCQHLHQTPFILTDVWFESFLGFHVFGNL